MGGLATNVSGDFLQLPPVDRPSIAMPLDDYGFKIPDELAGEQHDKQTRDNRADVEHRAGCESWTQS